MIACHDTIGARVELDRRLDALIAAVIRSALAAQAQEIADITAERDDYQRRLMDLRHEFDARLGEPR